MRAKVSFCDLSPVVCSAADLKNQIANILEGAVNDVVHDKAAREVGPCTMWLLYIFFIL
jgi:hypothetical protein